MNTKDNNYNITNSQTFEGFELDIIFKALQLLYVKEINDEKSEKIWKLILKSDRLNTLVK